ncbi:MAG: type II secretion system F family protein [Alphaproteobacteria bacterium]|nr:MAG: type II secretion system F family protein [Alphaproteobacteria bacterium]
MKLYLGIDETGALFQGGFTRSSQWARMTLRQLGCFYLCRLPCMRRQNLSCVRKLKPMFDALGDLLQAGVPLAVALDCLSQEKSYGGYRLLLQEIKYSLCHDGLSLGQALEKQPLLFGPHTVSFVKLAEHMGDYVHSCQFISHLFEKQMARDALMARIKGQLRIITTFMIIMFVALLVILVPQLHSFFQENSMDTGISTQFVIALSEGIAHVSAPIYLGFCLCLIASKTLGGILYDRLMLWSFFGIFKEYTHRIFLRIPFYRQYMRATLWFYMTCLVGRGIKFTDALEACAHIFPNNTVKKHLHSLYQQMEKGRAITCVLEVSFLCSHHTKEYIASLSSGNTIGKIIKTIATLEQDRLTRSTERLQNMIYPTGIVVLASVIVWIIYAVFFPIYHNIGIQL